MSETVDSTPSRQKRTTSSGRRKPKFTRGNLVWVRTGKADHPAYLVNLRDGENPNARGIPDDGSGKTVLVQRAANSRSLEWVESSMLQHLKFEEGVDIVHDTSGEPSRRRTPARARLDPAEAQAALDQRIRAEVQGRGNPKRKVAPKNAPLPRSPPIVSGSEHKRCQQDRPMQNQNHSDDDSAIEVLSIADDSMSEPHYDHRMQSSSSTDTSRENPLMSSSSPMLARMLLFPPRHDQNPDTPVSAEYERAKEAERSQQRKRTATKSAGGQHPMLTPVANRTDGPIEARPYSTTSCGYQPYRNCDQTADRSDSDGKLIAEPKTPESDCRVHSDDVDFHGNNDDPAHDNSSSHSKPASSMSPGDHSSSSRPQCFVSKQKPQPMLTGTNTAIPISWLDESIRPQGRAGDLVWVLLGKVPHAARLIRALSSSDYENATVLVEWLATKRQERIFVKDIQKKKQKYDDAENGGMDSSSLLLHDCDASSSNLTTYRNGNALPYRRRIAASKSTRLTSASMPYQGERIAASKSAMMPLQQQKVASSDAQEDRNDRLDQEIAGKNDNLGDDKNSNRFGSPNDSSSSSSNERPGNENMEAGERGHDDKFGSPNGSGSSSSNGSPGNEKMEAGECGHDNKFGSPNDSGSSSSDEDPGDHFDPSENMEAGEGGHHFLLSHGDELRPPMDRLIEKTDELIEQLWKEPTRFPTVGALTCHCIRECGLPMRDAYVRIVHDSLSSNPRTQGEANVDLPTRSPDM